MFLREIALKALRKAGLAHGDNVPADRFALAVDEVGSALRYYSDCDTITCFSEHKTVEFGSETTIGYPSLRRGARLHCVSSEDDLPSLASYQPSDGSYVIGRDYWHADDTDLFYTIRKDGDTYDFETCFQDEFATTKADVFVKNLAKILAVYDGNGEPLHEVTLSKFYGYSSGVYVANVDGDGRLKVYTKAPGNYDIVYIRSLVFNENTQVDLPASQEKLIVLHTAHALARSSEKKASIKSELNDVLSAVQDASLDSTIPTRSEW